jgi:gamma-glutamyl-gamma-aminobutyrate hydrolase PuuD
MQITIAVPYRSDAKGKAHDNDLCLLETGALWDGKGSYRSSKRTPRSVTVGSQECSIRAVTLISSALYDASRSDESLPNTFGQVGSSSLYCSSIDKALVDALFVPGGPTAHPTQPNDAHSRSVGKAWETARHDQEEAAITYCRDNNMPVFAICGGSWRLAAVLGAKISLLGGDARDTHNKSFLPQQLMVRAHDVTIEKSSHLRQLFDENYRGYLSTKDKGDPYTDLQIPVNSSHWAQSTFSPDSSMRVNALSENVTEGYEDPSRHFCVGVQWHPEYAQVHLTSGDKDDRAYHRLLMENFMRAAAARHAAVTIQRSIRAWLKRLNESKVEKSAIEGK